MIRSITLSLLLVFLLTQANAQVKSPKEFLGYEVGSRLTPHWKIVDYFRHVAAQTPSMVKLEQYGQTNEGRPLLVTFISSATHISNLEQVRLNNLRLANLSNDRAAPVEQDAPAIVWLSYNVHGNESSSSESSMLMLYALVDPGNSQTKEWLKNTVVVIDPCINPDGRDRYVNWYNSVVGKKADPLVMAREHREPWPGGRSNHYNFDLNRDWAWQTQVESRQRVALYNKWMPQVHVDYHEQWFDSHYYFAPAAEPLHEVITPWQREFQATIGKNNAKYFDNNGWLYFTKEFFDLFYPSYGDTYPTFNGAIGMTYEQAGHGMAGTAILGKDGDTLTLTDRATHHYTTGISTVEISSKNAGALIKNFRKYFQDAVFTGVGDYKSYVIRNQPADAERVSKFLELLTLNDIRYGWVSANGAGKGFSYASGKEENFNYSQNDIVVYAQQPRSAMVKVLMEPRTKLPDSLTYDISAWSVPYAYGLTTYASREKINAGGSLTNIRVQNTETSYGYVIDWKGVNTAKTVGQLLQKGILLRYAEQPFELSGRKFERGAVIVLKTANRNFAGDLWKTVRTTADNNNIQLHAINSGMVDRGFDFGSEKVKSFKAPKVVMLTGEGVSSLSAGEIWHFFENQLDYPLTVVNANDATGMDWNAIQVLILPEGNYRFLADKSSLDEFKSWVNRGGRVIAIGSATNPLLKADIGLREKSGSADKKDSTGTYTDLKKFADRERDAIKDFTPGSILRVDLDNSHPLGFGYPGYYYTLKTDDRLFEFIKDGGWNVGVIKKDNQVSGFIGSAKKEKFQDGLLFGVIQYGGGTITVMADNPLFRSFWENGKLLLCNAIFFVGQ